MKITGLWKVKKVGIFDPELGMQMKTVEEVYAMEDSEEVTQAKEMLETYLKVLENGTMRISMFVSEDIIAQAKAEGEEIPLNEDGSVSLPEMKWKEENGEIFSRRFLTYLGAFRIIIYPRGSSFPFCAQA